jgi:competence protein ComGC
VEALVEALVVVVVEVSRLLMLVVVSVVEVGDLLEEALEEALEALVKRKLKVSTVERWRRSAKGKVKVKVSGVNLSVKVLQGLVN